MKIHKSRVVSGIDAMLAGTGNNPIGVYQVNIKTTLTIPAAATISSFFLSLLIGENTVLQKPESIPITYTNGGVTTTMMSICVYNSAVQPFYVIGLIDYVGGGITCEMGNTTLTIVRIA